MANRQRSIRENAGHALSGAMNLIVFGLLFYVTVAPAGLLIRLSQRDPLRLRFDPEAESYWIRRAPPGPSPRSMKDQY
jgi:hypothetical protein